MTHLNRHSSCRILIAVLAIGMLVTAVVAQTANAADPRDPIQREDIALIDKQLQRIDLVIDRLEARQNKQPNRRVILDINRLRTDVDEIRNGLRAYLSPPRMQPREPAPLFGAYQAQQQPGAKP